MLQVPRLLYALVPIYIIIGVVVVRRSFQTKLPRVPAPAFLPES